MVCTQRRKQRGDEKKQGCVKPVEVGQCFAVESAAETKRILHPPPLRHIQV